MLSQHLIAQYLKWCRPGTWSARLHLAKQEALRGRFNPSSVAPIIADIKTAITDTGKSEKMEHDRNETRTMAIRLHVPELYVHFSVSFFCKKSWGI